MFFRAFGLSKMFSGAFHPQAVLRCEKEPCPYQGGGGVMFRAGENVNLQILARQNLCHFVTMSEQITYGSQ